MSVARLGQSEKTTTEVIADRCRRPWTMSKRNAWRISMRPVGVKGPSGPAVGGGDEPGDRLFLSECHVVARWLASCWGKASPAFWLTDR